MKKVDLMVVGQGIAGSVLSFLAIQRGLDVVVVDAPLPGRSTYVSGGLFNPVTGRRVRKSWNYDLFYKTMKDVYLEIDRQLGVQTFYEMPIYRLLTSKEELNNWETQRLESEYVAYMKELFFDLDLRLKKHEAAGVLDKGGFLNAPLFLTKMREYLNQKGEVLEEKFDYSLLTNDSYKNFTFDHIVFCEGYRVFENPYFSEINLWATKGETLLIKMEGESFDYVVNKNIFLIPMGKGIYKVGSTLERNLDLSTTQKGLEELKEKISSVVKVPFRVIQQQAGIRPNVRDRKPLLGVARSSDNIFLLNGLGSKGISLAPYCAEHLLQYIYGETDLDADLNWQRIFKRQ